MIHDFSERHPLLFVAALCLLLCLPSISFAAGSDFVVLYGTGKTESDAQTLARQLAAKIRPPLTVFGTYVVSQPYPSLAAAKKHLVPGASVVGVSPQDAALIRARLAQDVRQDPAPPINLPKPGAGALQKSLECDADSLFLPAFFYSDGVFVQRCVQVDRAFFSRIHPTR